MPNESAAGRVAGQRRYWAGDVAGTGLDAFNREDTQPLVALSDDDLETRPATLIALEGKGSVYRGKDAWTNYFAGIHETWDEWRIEEGDVFDVDDDWVVATFRMVGTGRDSGALVEHPIGSAYGCAGARSGDSRPISTQARPSKPWGCGSRHVAGERRAGQRAPASA